jgi:prepilin peptidase CpaA
MAPDTLLLATASIAAAIAALIDYRTGHIPNWLTLGALASGVVLQVSQGALSSGWQGAGAGLVTSLAGILVCSIVPLIMYRVAGMGGGDLKLLAAIGALCGPSIGLQAQLYSFIAVLLYAPARMAYQGKLLRTLKTSLVLLVNPLLPKARRSVVPPELMTSLRFGPAVAAGVVATALAHWGLG